MRAISEGCGAPMRSKVTPARLAMKGMSPSFLRSTSVTDTPVLLARPVRPLLWMYVSGSCMRPRTAVKSEIKHWHWPQDSQPTAGASRCPGPSTYLTDDSVALCILQGHGQSGMSGTAVCTTTDSSKGCTSWQACQLLDFNVLQGMPESVRKGILVGLTLGGSI